MRWYAKINDYGNETSVGFSNTWAVLAFSSRAARNEFIRRHGDNNMSVGPVRRSEIKNYVDAPKPFSGQYRGVVDAGHSRLYPGCLGAVDLCWPGEGERL